MDGTRAKGSRYRLGGVFSAAAPCSGDMEVSGRWSNRKLHSRERANISSLPSPLGSGKGGVWGFCHPCGVTGDDSLPWGWEEGMCSSSTHRTFKKKKLLFQLASLTFLYPVVAFMSPGLEIQSSWWIKGMSAASPLKSESFITLSRQEKNCDKIKLTKEAMFIKERALCHIFAKKKKIFCYSENPKL